MNRDDYLNEATRVETTIRQTYLPPLFKRLVLVATLGIASLYVLIWLMTRNKQDDPIAQLVLAAIFLASLLIGNTVLVKLGRKSRRATLAALKERSLREVFLAFHHQGTGFTFFDEQGWFVEQSQTYQPYNAHGGFSTAIYDADAHVLELHKRGFSSILKFHLPKELSAETASSATRLIRAYLPVGTFVRNDRYRAAIVQCLTVYGELSQEEAEGKAATLPVLREAGQWVPYKQPAYFWAMQLLQGEEESDWQSIDMKWPPPESYFQLTATRE